jgi:hypothetical protein
VAPGGRFAARPLGILASPRRRRRAALVAGALLVGITGVWLVVAVGNTASPPLPVTNRPAIVQHPRPTVKLTAAERRAIVAVGKAFILTAVRRDHPGKAWALASDALRRGTSRAAWNAGTLPFAPYPVRSARWNLAYAVEGEVGLDVLVTSTDPETRPLVHRLTLVHSRRASGPRWLVDSWTPESGTPGNFVVDDPLAAAAAPDVTPRPSRLWILLPFAILLAAIVAPFVILLHSRYEERRMRRRRRAVHGR